MKNKTGVFFNSIMYTIGNLLLKSFSFFLIPLYTRCLTTEEYGITNLASGFYTVLAYAITFNTQKALVRYYVDFKDDNERVKLLFGTSITFVFVVSFIFITGFSIMRKIVTPIFFPGLPFFPIALLSSLIAVVSGIYIFYQEILRGMQEAKFSILLSYLYFFLLLASNVLTVVKLHLGAFGVLVSIFFVNFIMTITMFWDLSKRNMLKIGIDINILKTILKYSFPLMPHTIAYNVSDYVTKVVISEHLTLSVLGVYSLSAQFGNVADVVLNSIQSAFQPWMFNILKEKQNSAKSALANVTYLLLWLYGVFFISIALFSKEVILFMVNDGYQNAWRYVSAIVVVIALKSPSYFYMNFLYYDINKTKYIFYPTVIGSIANIAITIAAVPIWGIWGSILADFVSMVLRTYALIFLVRDEIKKYYSQIKIIGLSIFPIVFIIIGVLLSYLKKVSCSFVLSFICKFIILLSYLILFYFVNKKNIINILKEKRFFK